MQAPHSLIPAALACIVTVLPIQAAGLDDLTWSTAGGKVTITDCNEAASGELVIPAAIEGLPVTAIGDFAFRSCDILSSITLPETVTSIGSRAFQFCDSLTSMDLPEGISSIAPYTFYGCTRLSRVTIPDSVTAIGSRAFQECSLLASIVIPESVIEISTYVFYRCSRLIDITIPESLTTIGAYAFRGCTRLPAIVIPGNVSTLPAYAFYDCPNLASVDLPPSLTTIGEHAFQNCESLPSIVIPDGVTTIGAYAFQNCLGILEISIPGSVTEIGTRAFQYCESLPTIVLPDSITSIPSYAFYGCRRLASITLQGAAPTVGDAAFNNLPAGGTAYVYEQFAPGFGGIGGSWQGFTVEALSGFQTVSASIALGSGTITGTGTYESGSSIILTATPAPGYAFLNWSGDASGTTNPLTVVLESDLAMEALFVEQTTYDAIFNAGREAVTSDPNSHDLVSQASYNAVVAERDARFTEDQVRALSADYTIGLNAMGNVQMKINFFESTDLESFAPFAVSSDSVSVVEGSICLEFAPEDNAAFFRFSVE